jgi:ketosteroid isomerase-like protein
VTSDDVLRRLQRLEDRAQLRELVNRYCLAIDDGDWDALTAMFTDGAEMGGVTGGPAVVARLRSNRSAYGRTIHTATGQVLDFTDDDHASGVVPSAGELAIAGQTVRCAMRYLDDYERVAGSWRFARRSIRFSYALPWTDLAGAMTAERPVAWPGAEPAPADDLHAGSGA